MLVSAPMRTLVLLLIALWHPPMTSAQGFVEKRFEVRETPDILLADAPVLPKGKTVPLHLDLYEPQGSGMPQPRPGVILVHGGGFRGGSRKSASMVSLCRDLSARGYVCISIDYRVEGDRPDIEAPSPRHEAIYAAMQDASVAIEWMIQNAERYRIDAGRLAIGGSSAGSTAALLAAYANPAELPPVRAAIAMWGGIAGPLSLIAKGKPPMMIIHGTADKSVPFFVATDMEQQARKEGVPVKLLAVKDAGHGIDLSLGFEGKSFYEHIAEFLNSWMK